MVSAWPEPPFATHAVIIAGAHDGMETLALGGATTTERRPNQAEESIAAFNLLTSPANNGVQQWECPL